MFITCPDFSSMTVQELDRSIEDLKFQQAVSREFLARAVAERNLRKKEAQAPPGLISVPPKSGRSH